QTSGLHDFKLAIVVEVLKPRVPGPCAARHAKRFRTVYPRRYSRRDTFWMACAGPQEVALLKSERRSDIADVHIEKSVIIDVPKVDAHSLEGILPDDERFGTEEALLSVQFLERNGSRLRLIP